MKQEFTLVCRGRRGKGVVIITRMLQKAYEARALAGKKTKGKAIEAILFVKKKKSNIYFNQNKILTRLLNMLLHAISSKVL